MVVRRVVAVVAVFATSFALASGPPAGAAPAAAPAPDPVIVVAGFTIGPTTESIYYPMVDRLRRDGYDTTLMSYPDYGLGEMRTHALRLQAVVAAVKARTGAAKVDLVAHSMGGVVSREYLKHLGGTAHVDSLIMLGTPNHGTTYADLSSLLLFGNCLGIAACTQMTTGSAYLAGLNAGDDTLGAVRYTAIATMVDQLVTPYTSTFLADDGNIANITVQQQCWNRWPEHYGLVLDAAVYDGVRDALRGQPVRMDCLAG